jgi:hypothetical protein
VHQERFRKSGQVGELEDWPTIAEGKALPAFWWPLKPTLLTQRVPARITPFTPAAVAGREGHDVVTRSDVRDVTSDFSHDSGALVAEDRWKRNWKLSSKEMQIAVTESRCLHVDDDFVWIGSVKGDVLDEELS